MSTTENGAPAPPPAPPRRRLTRSRRDRVIAGVCGGLGEYFDLDPVIFRIAFVVLVFLGGAGILLYPAAWILLPEEGHGRSIGEGWVRHGAHGRWLPIALVTIGAIVLAGDMGARHHDGGIGFAIIAIVVGVLLLRRHPHPPSSVAPPPAAAPEPGAPEPGAPEPPLPPEPAMPSPPDSGSWTPPPGDDGTWEVRDEPRQRGGPSLAAVVFSVLLIGGGVVGLLHAADVVSVSVPVFLAGALVFVGLALLASAWIGGTPGLIALGVVLTVALGVATVVHAPFTGGFGERRWVPGSVEEVRSRYRLGAGDATLDLSHVTLPSPAALDVRASVGAGQLRVIVPGRGRVVADAHGGIGDLHVLGRHDDGWDVDQHVASGDSADGSLRLHLEVGAGEVDVVRAA